VEESKRGAGVSSEGNYSLVRNNAVGLRKGEDFLEFQS